MKKPNIKLDIQALQNSVKNFNWSSSLKKLSNPQAADDLNHFLEKMPQNAGQTMLIIAGVAWAFAGAVGLFTAVQLQKITELRMELDEAQALQPIVPKVVDKAVNAAQVKDFVESTKDIYTGLEMKASGSTITIQGKTTNGFGQFREAIGHVQNGGSGWRVSVDKLCVGRECDKNPLNASLKINTVSVTAGG